uniref:Uncharacterized protein n=1 Tax=Chromera velia CCMP2878 TaxID=1169474 RepID=A0A0G4FRU7_9ALVE|eukprot:Cvel_18450.t1-p1 / transcript=Cvel_18450.t1 / gene=Cvel_18450 / organism=Chromera_velia_CCMP2878 / gene_product=hypothetical protein / transcript_product=hypothetical protein / location=Cvel_scaffold1528:31927-35505(-) / protein_length=783 / sequence_SO=supercontig / SO=protein_coding / is_pseudo=false
MSTFFPLEELLHSPPSETLLRFLSSHASVVLRSICKSFNERAMALFDGETTTKVTEEVVQNCGFPLLRWLLDLPQPPEPEQVLFAVSAVGGEENLLALLLGTSPAHSFGLLSAEAELGWDSIARFFNFCAVLQGAVWGNRRALFEALLREVSTVIDRDELLSSILKDGWVQEAVTDGREWVVSSILSVTGGCGKLCAEFRHLSRLAKFPSSVLEELVRGGMIIHEHLFTFSRLIQLKEQLYRLTVEADATLLIIYALKGEVEKVEDARFPRGRDSEWDADAEGLYYASTFVKYLLVAAVVADSPLESIQRLYDWAVSRLGERLHDPEGLDRQKAEFHAIVFATEMQYSLSWSRDSDQDVVHAIIRRGPPEKAVAFLEWMRSLHPRVGWNGRFCDNAVYYNQLEVLKWLQRQEEPCPWGPKEAHMREEGPFGDYARELSGVTETPSETQSRADRAAFSKAKWSKDWETMKRLRTQDPPVPWGFPDLDPETPPELRAYEVDVARHLDEADEGTDPPPPPQGLEVRLAEHINACLDKEMDIRYTFANNFDPKTFPPFFFQRAISRFDPDPRLFVWLLHMGAASTTLIARLLRMGSTETKGKLKERLRKEFVPAFWRELSIVLCNFHKQLFPDVRTFEFLLVRRVPTKKEYEMHWQGRLSGARLGRPASLSGLSKAFEERERKEMQFVRLIEAMEAEGVICFPNVPASERQHHRDVTTVLTRLVEGWGREGWRPLLDRCRSVKVEGPQLGDSEVGGDHGGEEDGAASGDDDEEDQEDELDEEEGEEE